jgi:hypothetical protein
MGTLSSEDGNTRSREWFGGILPRVRKKDIGEGIASAVTSEREAADLHQFHGHLSGSARRNLSQLPGHIAGQVTTVTRFGSGFLRRLARLR